MVYTIWDYFLNFQKTIIRIVPLSCFRHARTITVKFSPFRTDALRQRLHALGNVPVGMERKGCSGWCGPLRSVTCLPENPCLEGPIPKRCRRAAMMMKAQTDHPVQEAIASPYA